MATAERAQLIDRVIEARRPLAERVAGALRNLDGLAHQLDALERARAHVLGELEGPGTEEVASSLRELELPRLRLGLEAERHMLLRLESRLKRDHLALGVVGRARQGKSRLLQTLTGLSANEIPDGDRTHCTGVRSTLVHRPELEPHAEVWLHSERSFLDDVVSPYYAELSELGPAPRSLSSWRRPETSERLLGARGAKLAHLQKAFDALDGFRDLLGEVSPKRIPVHEVRAWVAQSSADGETPYVNYLAVKEVKITCAYPYPDLARMSVVDMPGLGDTGVGDEARLLHTLGHEIDAVLFVRMPKTLGDHWADVDVDLYDLARRALPELPLEQWAFFILNRTRAGAKQGDNERNCVDLLESAESQGLAAVHHVVADCSEGPEVFARVLDPVLEHLAGRIEALDRAYATACAESLLDFVREAHHLIDGARVLLARAGSGDRENPLYRRLFEETWEDLAGGLEGYLARLQQRREEEDPDLAEHIQSALAASRRHSGIPDVETIERRRHARGSYAIAYHELLHEVRTELSRCFLRLDEGLKRGLVTVKEGVADVLRGPLGAISDAPGIGFLGALRERLPPEAGGLAEGFEMLLDFDLSYRGLIQHRIRRHLDGLTPDLTTLQLSSKPDAAELRAYLETLQKEALYQAELALSGLLYEPNQAAFAIVEEFIDRVLRARGARTEWDLFLFELRSEVWRGEFDRLESRTRTRRRWEEATQTALLAAAPDRFTILEKK